MWVIKTRLQLQHNANRLIGHDRIVAMQGVQYRGFFHAAALIWKHEGLRGMFKVRPPAQFHYYFCICTYFGSRAHAFPQGVSASYLGVAESVLQFTMYETIKAEYGSSFGAYGTALEHVAHFSVGALSKLTASVITYPHEVVRTRLRQIDSQK